MDKYLNDDGKIGVIVSGDFGAGWSTWGHDVGKEFLAMDKGLVELKLQGASSEEVEKYILDVKGEDTYIYTGGWDDAKVEWIDQGSSFTIEEYDGSESLRFISDLSMTA